MEMQSGIVLLSKTNLAFSYHIIQSAIHGQVIQVEIEDGRLKDGSLLRYCSKGL